ncbi:MAG: hypothetical protein ABW202_22210 [Duganella sp.]
MMASWRLLALLSLAALAWSLSTYPWQGHWLAPLLLIYAIVLCWRPHCWLLLLPALLPVLDLAPSTGWFFLEEIDLLLLVTTGIGYARLPRTSTPQAGWPPWCILGLALMMLACVTGLWRALYPLPAIDLNAFNNYLSPYNAIRVGKAWFWSLLLLPLLRAAAGPQLDGVQRYLVPGMLIGLLLVCGAGINERVSFPGLLNFSSDYRITARFSAMHTGGAALDGYLALCTPLAALWLIGAPCWWRTPAALVLLGLALYAGLATFSRGVYLAYTGSLAIILYAALHSASVSRRCLLLRVFCLLPPCLALLWLLDQAFMAAGYRGYAALLCVLVVVCITTARLLRHRLALGASLAVLLVMAPLIPVYHGYYVAQRFSTTGDDLALRHRHWQHIVALMDSDAATRLLGMGLGTFPASYYWRNPGQQTLPSYRYMDQAEEGNSGKRERYLRLASGRYAAGYGELLRFWQSVEVKAHNSYTLAIDVRTINPPAFLHWRLCERQLLYPVNCIAAPMLRLRSDGAWTHYSATVNTGPVGSRRVPVRLELALEGQGAVVDVDNVGLHRVGDEASLLRNGSFTQVHDDWFFSSDRQHLPWHIKNLLLNLYFEMGVPAVLAYLVLLLGACVQQWQRMAEQRHASGHAIAPATWLAGLAGFQVVGLFDSLLDVPRITLLFLLVLAATALRPASLTSPHVLPATSRPVIPGSSRRGKK